MDRVATRSRQVSPGAESGPNHLHNPIMGRHKRKACNPSYHLLPYLYLVGLSLGGPPWNLAMATNEVERLKAQWSKHTAWIASKRRYCDELESRMRRGGWRLTDAAIAHDAKTQHNPGPWRIAPELADTILCSGSGGYRISDMADDPLHPIRPADVRLMAAAPEMLAALEALTECPWLQVDDYEYQMGEDSLAALKQARAAIAKAKGEPTS